MVRNDPPPSNQALVPVRRVHCAATLSAERGYSDLVGRKLGHYRDFSRTKSSRRRGFADLPPAFFVLVPIVLVFVFAVLLLVLSDVDVERIILGPEWLVIQHAASVIGIARICVRCCRSAGR